jgi:hypothetical protein
MAGGLLRRDPDESTEWIGKPFRAFAVERLRMWDAVNRFLQLEATRGPCGLSLVAFACDRVGKSITPARDDQDA